MLNNIYFTIALMIITSYLVMIVFLYFMQERLIFQGAYGFKKIVQENRYIADGVKEFSLNTSDNINLDGVISSNNNDTLLIYFGGNAENITNFISMTAKFDHIDIAGFNYRGYDKSEGVPNEKLLYSDALKIYDYFKNRYKYIIPVGKSLGSTIVAYISANRKTHGTILITPFDSVTNIAKNIYPFIPVKKLLKYPFDTLKHLQNITTPISLLIAGKDNVVPMQNSLNVKENIKNPLLITTIKDKGHNSIINDEKFLEFILLSVEKIKSKETK